ncbi:MAG: arsenate reductase [Hyphomicrobiaceae bacterium]|jgi:arsenate reductase
MTEMTLYGLKNCDTCKKALKALKTAEHDVTFVDIRAEADLATKVPTWLAAVGAEALINKRSTTWRGLSDTERAGADGDGATSLLVTNATLIKRPIIEAGDDIHVGWAKNVSDALA